MRYREISKKLKKLGCDEIPRKAGGSHRKWKNSGNGQATVVPDWGNKDLKEGTVRAIVKKLGLDWNDFERV